MVKITSVSDNTLEKVGEPSLKQYLNQIIDYVKTKEQPNKQITSNKLVETLFDTLLSHDFCYLTRTQVVPYTSQIIDAFQSATQKNKPLPMYLDLGPGYHAALEKSDPRRLSFEVDLGELLVLYQMRKFINRVNKIYPPGAEFNIIIDNVCAVYVNDINTKETEHYCSRFRELIREMNMEDHVKLLVESEHFNVSDYDVKPIPEDEIKSYELTKDEHENVERFIGRACSKEEAIRRILTYKQIGDRTDELFYSFFQHGVHMTQRASKHNDKLQTIPRRRL